MASTIEWTDETWNPVTGCSRVSPGCDNCYMFALYPRLHAMGVPGYEAAPDIVQMLPNRLNAPLTWAKPRRVFVNSMSDLFHKQVTFEFITDVFKVMREADQHIFQVLTKRPGRAVGWWEQCGKHEFGEWPKNVWIGTSVENQKYAPRLTVLGRIPAEIRFVSAEPLLDSLDLTEWLRDGTLQWVIVGGESGPRARPMEEEWALGLRDQSIDTKVAFFFKQWGGRRGKRSGEEALLEGELWQQYPVAISVYGHVT